VVGQDCGIAPTFDLRDTTALAPMGPRPTHEILHRQASGREPFGNHFKIRSSARTPDCEQEVLARLPKPVVIALAVLAGLVALPIVLPALLLFLIGDGSGLGLLFRLGLLVVVIVGSRRLARHLKESPTSVESLRTAGVAVLELLRTAGVAVARTIPPLARTIAGGTSQLFQALKSAVIYLCGCRWPVALIWFLVTFGIFILQADPGIGFFLMLLLAPFWSIVTINLGFAQLIVEPAIRKISPAWSLVGLSWFAGYAAVSIHAHTALDRLSAEIATENSRQSLPFDPRTQSLVVVRGKFYDAPSAERLLTTYPLSVVYEEVEDAGDATNPTSARDDRPRFTALRLGRPELCDSITDNTRLKAVVTQHIKAAFNGMLFCSYTAIEAPDLPVVRLRFEQEELRVVGVEGHIDRITLTSGGDKRQVASVNAEPYRYLPLPVVGCFLGGDRWKCTQEFLKEERAYSDNDALIGKSLGLERSSPASRSDEIYAGGPAALERAQNLAEAAALAELDRLLAKPVGSIAPFTVRILSARPDLIASRAERLAVAAAEAFTTRENPSDVQAWSDLMVALPDADFRRVGPSFAGAMLARSTAASGRHFASLSDQLIYRLADLGPAALPLLELTYRYNRVFGDLASIIALCRLGAPAAELTEKFRANVFNDRHQGDYDLELREAMILALMRQGRADLADAGRQQYEQWAATLRFPARGWSKDFEEKSREMTPSSSPDACMITRN
jgi:hypothetical protein